MSGTCPVCPSEIVGPHSADLPNGAGLDRFTGPLVHADRWIINHWNGEKDHACAECVPNGPMVEPGFRCAPHAAYVRIAAR